jgi:hypothetical protein
LVGALATFIDMRDGIWVMLLDFVPLFFVSCENDLMVCVR